MRTRYRFIEGYAGNATVRGWRDYDSIYHAVFACMRGSPGYPKGFPYNTVPQGLLLRPAITNDEIFQGDGTYGPKANFKISLRELPDHGRFRVTVTAAKYNDGLLLDPGAAAQSPDGAGGVVCRDPDSPQTVTIKTPGIYQVDVYPSSPRGKPGRGGRVAARRGADRRMAAGRRRGEQTRTQRVDRSTGRGCELRQIAVRQSCVAGRRWRRGRGSASRVDAGRRRRLHGGGLDLPAATAPGGHREPGEIRLDSRLVPGHARQ